MEPVQSSAARRAKFGTVWSSECRPLPLNKSASNWIITLGLVLSLAPLAAAQADETNSLTGEVQSLRDELKVIRQELKETKAEVAAKAANASSAASLTNNEPSIRQSDLDALKDVLNEQILRDVGTKGSSTANGAHLVTVTGGAIVRFADTVSKSLNFSLPPNATIGLAGALRDDPSSDGNVTYNVSVGGSTGTGSASSIGLTDVYLQWDLKTAKLELEPAYTLSLRVGQQLVPYGLDNINGELARPTIYTAQYLSGIPGTFGRDIGFIAQGGFFNHYDPTGGATLNPLSGNTAASAVNPLIGYTVGVFNGAGANTIVVSNTSVAFVGKVVITPFPDYFSNFRNLSFGFDYYEGNLGPKNGERPTKRRFGPEFQWLRKPFLLTFEYVHSEDGFDGTAYNPATAPNGHRTTDSYVGTLFWTPRTLPDFQPWVRFDYYDPSWVTTVTPASLDWNASNARRIYSIGFNYFLYQVEPVTRRVYETTETERVIKLQIAYDYINYIHNNYGGDHRITGQIVYSF